jgi:multidrug transporter EmrE-like cation transporter
MELKSLIFILIGSVLHLGWNILAKKSEDKLAFLWLALVIPGIVGAFYLAQELIYGNINSTAWLCILGSGVIHSIYFATLSNAYNETDLSVVYPYSRGISTLLTTIIGVILLSESLSAIGYLGIALTIIATLMGPLLDRKHSSLSLVGFRYSVITGIMISFYLVIDKIALKHIEPLNYLMIIFFIMFICIAPVITKNKRFKNELDNSKLLPFAAGIFMGSAYLFVLFAMKNAPVSYVVSARASGIVISGVAGVIVFKEQVSIHRWFAIGLICLGVIFIGLA